MPKAHSQDTLNNVLSLLDSDESHAQIINKTGVSSAYITKVTQKYRPDLKRSKGGRPRKLNPTAIRYAVRLATKGSKFSTKQTAETLSTLTGEPVSAETVRRALKEGGLQAVKKVWKSKAALHHTKV